MAPHYLRFARTLAFVSIGLPAPVIAAEALAGCTGGGGDGTLSPSDSGPSNGTHPAPGVGPAPGVVLVPPTGVRCADPCGLVDGGEDASDAGDADSGGPSRGLPELPASWQKSATRRA